MSMWWDDDTKRYRTSLPHKVLRWGWPLIRLCLFLLPSERAHIFALHHALPLVGRIERAWEVCKAAGVFLLIAPLLMLAKLPWFRWEAEP